MCGHTCAKYTLIVFNVIFWLAGAALLGVSIWALVDKDATHLLNVVALSNSQQLIRAAAITLCVVGAVIFVIGFFGCCGAMKENACLLNTYAAIVIILLLGQVTAGVLAIVFKDRLMKELSTGMNTTVTTQYNQTGYDTQTQAFDFLQRQFECCGVVDPYYEWQASAWHVSSGKNVPVTCCVLQSKKDGPPLPVDEAQCQNDAGNASLNSSQYVYKTGCYDSMANWVRRHSAMLMGIAFGLAGLQILLAILACCMKNQMTKDNYQQV